MLQSRYLFNNDWRGLIQVAGAEFSPRDLRNMKLDAAHWPVRGKNRIEGTIQPRPKPYLSRPKGTPCPPATGIDRNLTHYADPGFSRYLRRAFLASAGYDKADLERPVVGIADTSSDYTTCHRAMPQLVEAVKRGVLHLPKSPMDIMVPV